jgi:ATP-dependent RNA helicase DDX3X
MCSATFPAEIQNLATQFLTNYVFLSIGRVGSTADLIAQELRYVDEFDKRGELHDVLQEMSGLVLIFVETKKTADYLDEFLYRGNYGATSIHGDKT